MEEIKPKETILSVLQRDRYYKWISFILAAGMLVMTIVAYETSKRPPEVWVVTEDGKITNNAGLFFNWEAQEAARHAIETFYIISPDRERNVQAYFSVGLVQRIQKIEPRDKFIGLQIVKVDPSPDGSKVQTKIQRQNEDVSLTLTLVKAERTQLNPFGLIVSGTSRIEDFKESEVSVKDLNEGLNVVLSSPNADKK